MRRLAVGILLLGLLIPASTWAGTIKTVAYVYAPNQFTFDYLRTFNVAVEESDRPDYVRIMTSRDTVRQLILAGFEVKIEIEDLDAWVAARSRHIRSLPPEAKPAKVKLDHFLNYTELTTFINDLAAAHPDIMSVETIGQTVLGKPLFLVKISDHVNENEAEPALFFENTIHGDEIAAYTQGLHIIQWLVEGYGTDPDITQVVDHDEIFFVPLTNPDGNYDDPVYDRSRYNDDGVDLNRNNGYMWIAGFGYGPSMHSEPETQALAGVWTRGQPISIAQSGHGGDVVVSLAWSYHYDEPLDWDEFDYLGEQYCYPQHCLDPDLDTWYQGSYGMYQMNGSTKDELYGSHGAMAWTTEMSYVKELSWSAAAETMVQHEPAMLFLMQEAQNGLHGIVTDADTSDPVAALVETDGKWSTFTDDQVGDFHKYLRAGTYDIRLYANGYDDYTDTVTINNGAPTNINVEMNASAEPKTFALRWLFSEGANAEETHTHTIDALGPPDAEFYSLGNNGYTILDLGPAGIDNGVGVDIAVYEGNNDGDETFALYGSTGNYFGPWTLIGNGTGTASFDLGALADVRYVKVVDTAEAGDAGQYDGYDLDAVGTPALFASFTADVTSGPPPLTVHFTDQSGGSPESWAWDFGDGGTSTAQNPTHEYGGVGTYTVTLTVTKDGQSNELAREDYITVAEVAPAAEFSAAPTTGPAPLEVTFTDESTSTITDWTWNFGDGGTSTEQDPVYTYETEGTYTVRLTVEGPGGSNTRMRWNYIKVSPPVDDDTTDDDVDDDVDDDIDDDVDDDVDDDIDDDVDDDVDDDTQPDDDVDDDANDNGGDDDSGCGC